MLMDVGRLGWVLAAVAMGVGMGASFGSGKTLFLSWGNYPRLVARRKAPVEFWMMIVFQGAIAAIAIEASVKISS
jgi:hypothetical protein